MDLAWYLSPPWDIVVIVAVLTVTGALIFYLRFCAYHRRYFADKAPAAGGDCYAGLVAHVRQLVRARVGLTSLFLPPGWLRIAVGGGVWWLLNQTVLAFGWEFVDRWLNALLG